MDYTAKQLYEIWDSGCKIPAMKELRRICDAGLKEAKDAFENHSIETAMLHNSETLKRARLERAAPDLLAALYLVRMSFGWQQLSEESKHLINFAITKAEGAQS